MTVPRAIGPVVCITQARVNSERLPAKVLRPILDEPLLWWHLTRLQQARRIDQIVVATTEEPAADAIVAIAERLGIAVFRGSEQDVLSRFVGAAALANAETVVRVTSDCPMIDPDLIDETIADYRDAGPECQYFSLDVATYPRGLDCEVFSRQALDEAGRDASHGFQREHVTPYIHQQPLRYGARYRGIPPLGRVHRWCVDTPADLDLVRRIIGALAPAKPDFRWRDILGVLDQHPDWADLNADIVQRVAG